MTTLPRVLDEFFNKSPFVYKGLIGDLDHMFDSLSAVAKYSGVPYNIVKTSDNTWVVEVAVAGFDKSELKVEAVDNRLTISGSHSENAEAKYVYRGIAARNFVIPFTFVEGIKVGSATLKDGMLRIVLERAKTELAKLIPILDATVEKASENVDVKAA